MNIHSRIKPVQRVSSRGLAGAISLTLLAPLCVFAQSNTPNASDDPNSSQMDPIVVTATRTAQTQDAALAAITVIDREDIERLQPDSLPELLRSVPGVAIANNGGVGKESSLFLRGTESDHTRVLIDGVKVGSATAGKAALQDIPVDQIDRIEIVRGPFSSLYGSDAIGGVIQIFTRRPHGTTTNASVAVGSQATRRASTGLSSRGDRGWFALQLAHHRTDGIDACRGYGAPVYAGCFTDEPDADGYRNNSVSLSGGYQFSDSLSGEISALYGDAFGEYDGGFANQANTAQQVLGGKLRYEFDDDNALSLHLGRQADLSQSLLDGDDRGDFDTHRREASLQGDFAIGGGQLTAGYDWMAERVDSDTVFDQTRRGNRALFGQWQRGTGAWSMQASLRRDDDSQFGGATTGSLLGGWTLSGGLRLTASYGSAFKAPSFNELYYPDFGNAALQPERSRSMELGLGDDSHSLRWQVNAYQTTIRDLIAFDASFVPANIDRTRIRGVELSASTDWAGWQWSGNLGWLDPRNISEGANDGKLLPRRARQTARLDGDHAISDWRLGFSVTASGERYDDSGNFTRLGGYATTDLRVGYKATEQWTLQLNAYNVFDRQYETAAYYNQPDRHWLLSVRYSGK